MRRKKLAVEQGETETRVVTRDAYDMLRKEAEEGKLATERYNNLIVRLKENERVLKTITDERDALKSQNTEITKENNQTEIDNKKLNQEILDLTALLGKTEGERNTYKSKFERTVEELSRVKSDHDFQTARLEEAHRAFDRLCQALTR